MYLFVAVDVLSRYLWVEPIKVKTATACRDALRTITTGNATKKKLIGVCAKTNQPEKIWTDQGREFAGEFAVLQGKGNCDLLNL